jgi:hypothetical protein
MAQSQSIAAVTCLATMTWVIEDETGNGCTDSVREGSDPLCSPTVSIKVLNPLTYEPVPPAAAVANGGGWRRCYRSLRRPETSPQPATAKPAESPRRALLSRSNYWVSNPV